MVRKVLISFLGTGPRGENDLAQRQYREATYRFQDQENGEENLATRFVARAVAQHFGIDNLIIIGTVKSMWEEVYHSFAQERGVLDEDVWFRIDEACNDATSDSPLQIPCQCEIEQAIGGDTHLIPIRYGLNEQEIDENSAIILGVEQYLQPDDEIYVDVTHSFRSLPIMLMNTLIYLQNVSSKRLKIKHILYGMLEMQSELGYAPVVELGSIMRMNEWITAAYAFSEFGNAYQLVELMEGSGDQSPAVVLKRFSDMMNLNYLARIKSMAGQLEAIKIEEIKGPFAKMILPTVLNTFIGQFKGLDDLSRFQYELATWQFEHCNYCASYLTLQEALITLVCERKRLDPLDKEDRDKVKDAFIGQNMGRIKYPEIIGKAYIKINGIRNDLVHSRINRSRNGDPVALLERVLDSVKEEFKESPS